MNPPENLVELAKKIAGEVGVDGALVCAVVEKESSWETWAIRYEPAFRARYVAPLELPPTAEIARSMSWGLMQLMGQSARELGFNGPLPQICDPATGLLWGAKKLARVIEDAHGDVAVGLELWNGGADPKYAADAMARMKNYE